MTSLSLSPGKSKIGLITLVSLVTGNLVGSGVFLLPPTLAAFGSLCLVGWIITSFGAIVLSLIFSGLSASSSRTGGPHTFVEDAFGNKAGFFAAWAYWVLSWIGNTGLVVASVGYGSSLLGGLSTTATFIAEVFLVIFISFINLMGVQTAGRFEVALTCFKVIALVGLPIIGIFSINPDNFVPFNATDTSIYKAVNATALLTLWCFMGLETGTVPASDVDNPKKNIPRAILIGTSVAAFIYIIGTITIMGVIPRAQLLISKAPYSDLAAHLFGGSWSIPFAVLATVSCIGTLNGWTMVVSRIASGAASDGLFPKFLKKETKSGAPLWGTIISSVCMIPIIALTLSEHLIEQFQFIIELATNVILFIYLACVFSYIIINKKNKTLSIFRIILSIIGLGFCIWTLCVSDMATHLCSLVVFLSGIPFFLWQRKTNMYKKRM